LRESLEGILISREEKLWDRDGKSYRGVVERKEHLHSKRLFPIASHCLKKPSTLRRHKKSKKIREKKTNRECIRTFSRLAEGKIGIKGKRTEKKKGY